MAEQKRLQDFIPSLSELPPQHAEWLIDGFIHQGVVTVISGEAGCGKTTWALAMAGAISKGERFAGLDTKQAPVLYMDRENPQFIAQQKIKDHNTVTGPDFLYWGMWVAPEPCSVWDAPITNYVKECNIKPVIVVDSFGAFFSGDENDNNTVRLFFRPLTQLAAAGASVIVIHHTGKSETSKKFRGAQAMKDAITNGFLVEKIGDGQILEQIKVTAWKHRMFLSEQSFNYSGGQFTIQTGPILKNNYGGLASIGLPFGR